MARVGTWILLILAYYLVMGLFAAMLSIGNLTTTGHEITSSTVSNLSASANLTSETTSSVWTAGSLFIDMLKFYTLGLDLGLGGVGNFVVNFIFIVIPGIMLALFVVLAIRGGSS